MTYDAWELQQNKRRAERARQRKKALAEADVSGLVFEDIGGNAIAPGDLLVGAITIAHVGYLDFFRAVRIMPPLGDGPWTEEDKRRVRLQVMSADGKLGTRMHSAGLLKIGRETVPSTVLAALDKRGAA